MIIEHSIPTDEDIKALSKFEYHENKCHIDFSDIIVDKPWGAEYLLFENDDAAIWILKITPNNSTSLHAHPNKSTSLIVLDGQSICQTLNKTYELSKLEAIILGKKVFHQTKNPISEDLYIMEIESPVNKHDLVRYKDLYGRQGSGYESKERFTNSSGITMNVGSRTIGNTNVFIDYAINKQDFLNKVSNLKNAIITILDRHIWSDNGEKLIEVGSSFKLKQMITEFMINDNFHYLIIANNEK